MEMSGEPGTRGQSDIAPEILVLGYGNELRGDDGAGPCVAEMLAARQLRGVRVVTAHQLTPDFAELIARAGLVIFVDARVGGERTQVSAVRASTTGDLQAHSSDPSALLALAETLYSQCPPAWCVSIPADSFEFGFGLSARTKAAALDALAAIVSLIDSFRARTEE